jgi:hypothetical protein
VNVTDTDSRTVSYRDVTFEPDLRFDDDPGVDSAWSEMMPLGKGFFKVPPEYQQGLGPGKPMDEEGSEYGMTVFHQLHCLAIIRATLNSLRAGDNHSDYMVHADHCVDYIRQVCTRYRSHKLHQLTRQGLMCSADLTIEHYGELENGKLASAVDGWYINHKCKDWDQIVRFATVHRSRDDPGII